MGGYAINGYQEPAINGYQEPAINGYQEPENVKICYKQAFDKRFFSNGTELDFNDQSVLPTLHCTMRKLHNVSVKRKYFKYFNNIFNIFFSVCASMETLPSIRQITL